MKILYLKIAVILLLIISIIGVRLATFAGPFLWYDELLAVTRIAGWNLRALENYLAYVLTNEPNTLISLSKYLSVQSESSLLDSIGILFKQGVLPFYYLITKIWVGLGYDNIWWVQVFSWLIGLANILVAAGLVWLLVEDKDTKNHATFLVAIIYCLSPFHIIYSREIRSYSLIIFILLLSYFCYEYYKKYKSNNAFTAFLLLLLIGLHIHVLFWIAASTYFGIFLQKHYVGSGWHFKVSRKLKYFVLTLMIGLVWPLTAIIFNIDPFHFSNNRLDWSSWTIASLWSISSIYCDLPFFLWKIYTNTNGFQLDLFSVIVVVMVWAAAVWALRSKTYRDLGLLVITPMVLLTVLDIFFNGQRVTISRYLFITHALSPITVAVFVTNLSLHRNKVVKYLTQVTMLVLLALQGVSTYYMSHNPYHGKPDPSLGEYASVMKQIKNLDYSVLYTQKTATVLLAISPYFITDLTLAGALERMNKAEHIQKLLDYACKQKKRVGIFTRVNDLSSGPVLPNQISHKLLYVREYRSEYFELGTLVCPRFTDGTT